MLGMGRRRRRVPEVDTPGTGEDGFVLISVVAALSILILVTMLLTRTTATDVKLAANLGRQARIEALADGVTNLVLQHLVVNPPAAGRSGQLRTDGYPAVCRMAGGVATIRVIDTDGQVNLNLASQDLLETVFAGVMPSKAEAKALAQAVVDFRSPGDSSGAGGSKLAAYQTAGLAHGPKNGAFATVGEIDQLPGMTPELRERLRPLLTVHSRSGVVKPQLAGLPVLLALVGSAASAGADEGAIEKLRDLVSLPDVMTSVVRTRSTLNTASNTFQVRVVMHEGSSRFVRQAVGALGASQGSGFKLREWVSLDPQYYRALEATDRTPDCLRGVLSLER